MYQGWNLVIGLVLSAFCGHSIGFWPFQVFAATNVLQSSTGKEGAPKRIAIIGMFYFQFSQLSSIRSALSARHNFQF
jgi:hypothetical protein